MWKPLSVIVGLMFVVWGANCALNRHVVYTNAAGRPLDAVDASHFCIKCGRLGLKAGEGYRCECTRCGLRFEARIDLGDGAFGNW